jgi:hypothetical protein
MGYRFPEQPILFYPSMARRIGTDEALLLAIYHDRACSGGRSEPSELLLSRAQWLKLADFWDEARVRAVTDSLVRQGCLDASCDSNLVRLRLQPDAASGASMPAAATNGPLPESAPERVSRPHDEPVVAGPAAVRSPTVPPGHETDTLSRLAVRDAPPRPLTRQALRAQPVPQSLPQTMQARGPAPTFGGASGWRRHKDELQMLFEQHEERNQQLRPMQLGWRPSETFFALLPRHNIAQEYAEGLLDEFVLYWLDKDRKETNWDQKFLAWVKREWVRKQTRDGRDTGADKERQTGFNHENTRRDTREKRKQVTAAIMDIRDTDW